MIEQAVDPNNSYEQRLQVITKKEKDLLTLKNELLNIQKDRSQLQHSSLQTLLQRFPIEKFNNQLSKEKLLVYLLQTGGIDELYAIYISQFYEGTLSANDQQFLISVKTGPKLDSKHKLKNIPAIIDRLNIDDFNTSCILNVDLVEYVAKESDENPIYFKVLVEQFKTKSDSVWQFFEEYRTLNRPSAFYRVIASEWPEFCDFLKAKYATDPTTLKNYFLWLFEQCSLDQLTKFNTNETISNYINDDNLILPALSLQSNKESARALLKTFSARIINLNVKDNVDWLNDHILMDRLYELNNNNIQQIFNYLSKDKTTGQWTLTKLFELEFHTLTEYIISNVNDFIQLVYLPHQFDTTESQSTLIRLLNMENIENTNKHSLLTKMGLKVQDITEVTDKKKLWPFILTNDHLGPNWKNVLNYFELDNSFTENFINFLNKRSNAKELSTQSIADTIADHDKSFALQNAIRTEKRLSDESYKELIKCTQKTIFTGWHHLDRNKATMLITSELVTLHPDSFSTLKETHPGMQLDLIIKNYDEYFSHLDDYTLSPEEYIQFLSSPFLTPTKRKNLIPLIPSTWILEQENMADAAARVLIESGEEVIPESTASALFKSNLSLIDKLRLFQLLTTRATDQQVYDWQVELGNTIDRLESHPPMIPQGLLDHGLLSYLKDNSYIVDHKVHDQEIELITARPD